VDAAAAVAAAVAAAAAAGSKAAASSRFEVGCSRCPKTKIIQNIKLASAFSDNFS
jgi:hypothetical protein